MKGYQEAGVEFTYIFNIVTELDNNPIIEI